jgi:hypothetical protein
MEHIAFGAREEKRRFWEEHLSRWEASGLSQKEYCRQNDLKIHCLLYWRKKQRCRPESTACLVEWPVPRQEQGLFCFEPALSVVIDRRYRIEIHKDFDPCVLDRVIRVLMQL